MPFNKVRFVNSSGADATFELNLKNAADARYHIRKFVPAGYSATANDPSPIPGPVTTVTIESNIVLPYRRVPSEVSDGSELYDVVVSTNPAITGRIEVDTTGGSSFVKDYTETDPPARTESSTEVFLEWLDVPLLPPGVEFSEEATL